MKDTSVSLSLKIGGAVALFLISVLGGLIPLKIHKVFNDPDLFLALANSFSGIVFVLNYERHWINERLKCKSMDHRPSGVPGWLSWRHRNDFQRCVPTVSQHCFSNGVPTATDPGKQGFQRVFLPTLYPKGYIRCPLWGGRGL